MTQLRTAKAVAHVWVVASQHAANTEHTHRWQAEREILERRKVGDRSAFTWHRTIHDQEVPW